MILKMKNRSTTMSQPMVPLLMVLLFSSVGLFGQTAVNRGKALYESKKYEEAEKILEAIPKKTSDYAAAQYYLGRIAFDKKEYDDAVDYFKEATITKVNRIAVYSKLIY
jgi:tetratricopeptide (TPR) repeat protein